MRGNAGSGPRERQFSQGSPGPGLAEALVVWAFLAVLVLLVLITYSRITPHELYHVTRGGLAGGLSRVLVFLNWPGALMAIPVLGVVLDRLLAAGRRVAIFPALLALVLCVMIGVPGVVDQHHLDAKWINVLPGVGVAIVLAMTIWAVRVTGTGGSGNGTGDRARILVAAALTIVALSWLFAEMGIYIGDMPLLGHVFRSKQLYFHDKELAPSVHLGVHHGFVGLELIVTGLLLSRELPRMHVARLRTALAGYLSLATAYGIGNIANDAWLEQVVKRGWTRWEIPGMIRPDLKWIWGVTILLAGAIYVLFGRRIASVESGDPHDNV